jgi:hypothetical protein
MSAGSPLERNCSAGVDRELVGDIGSIPPLDGMGGQSLPAHHHPERRRLMRPPTALPVEIDLPPRDADPGLYCTTAEIAASRQRYDWIRSGVTRSVLLRVAAALLVPARRRRRRRATRRPPPPLPLSPLHFVLTARDNPICSTARLRSRCIARNVVFVRFSP